MDHIGNGSCKLHKMERKDWELAGPVKPVTEQTVHSCGYSWFISSRSVVLPSQLKAETILLSLLLMFLGKFFLMVGGWFD